jgi:hypothetical protein
MSELTVSNSAEIHEVNARIEEDLKKVLVDVQQYVNPSNMARSKPEKWLFIAGELCKGKAASRIFREQGGDYYAIRKIQAQIAESPVANDLKRELSTHVVENLQFSAEIQPKLNSVILEKLERGEAEDMNLGDLMKAKRELGVDMKLANETLARLRGDNVQRIEVTHKEYSKDDYLADLKRIDEINDVIDVDDNTASDS